MNDNDRELAFANIKKAARHYDVEVEESSWKDLIGAIDIPETEQRIATTTATPASYSAPGNDFSSRAGFAREFAAPTQISSAASFAPS